MHAFLIFEGKTLKKFFEHTAVSICSTLIGGPENFPTTATFSRNSPMVLLDIRKLAKSFHDIWLRDIHVKSYLYTTGCRRFACDDTTRPSSVVHAFVFLSKFFTAKAIAVKTRSRKSARPKPRSLNRERFDASKTVAQSHFIVDSLVSLLTLPSAHDSFDNRV